MIALFLCFDLLSMVWLKQRQRIRIRKRKRNILARRRAAAFRTIKPGGRLEGRCDRPSDGPTYEEFSAPPIRLDTD